MKKLLIASMALALLAGCTTLKRATGQIDDTVLPGQRSDILAPDQQVARDPNVAGNPAVPPGGNISQAPVNPNAPQVAGNMPRANVATGSCDPKVDLCPEQMAPDPVAPISPVKPVTPMATKTATTGVKSATADAKSTVVKTATGAKPTTVKVASKPPVSADDAANGNLAAGQVLTDPNAPADATKKAAATTTTTKKVVKKKVIKKKPAAAAAATAPVDPNAPADGSAAVPAAPKPQGQ